MPNQTDWILLKKKINDYKGDIAETWGYIIPENAQIVSTHKYHEKDLFEFLLTEEHFSDANTVASSILLFTEKNMQLIYNKHHSIYHELLKLLCTDKMILLYEQYYVAVYEKNTDTIAEKESEFNNIPPDRVYRTAISKRYEKMISDNSNNNDNSDNYDNYDNYPSNIIIELISEFKFLTHAYLEDFYHFSTNVKNIDAVNKFVELYKKYTEFVPLIYRLINEYFLEYIKYQVKTIEDMIGNSFIIVSEYYENLKTCILSLPKNYIDYRYKDHDGNNILFYLITLPTFSEQLNKEIYQDFFNCNDELPLNTKNYDGNTMFHFIALYENDLFLQELLRWFSTKTNNLTKNEKNNELSELLKIENTYEKTTFDILLEKNNYLMLTRIINYMPAKSYSKLTNKLIENFEIVDKIPTSNLANNLANSFVTSEDFSGNYTGLAKDSINKIYIDSINYFIDLLHKTKYEITYDLVEYCDYKSKIIKLLTKCPNEIDTVHDYCLEWLIVCIMNNEFDLFKTILSKYFYNEHNNNSKKYLSKLVTAYGEPIIITAIKQQKISFVKYLLNYDIDLLICDKTNRNSLIAALETKNIYLICLLREHIVNNLSHIEMVTIMSHFIDLIEHNESFNTFSITTTINRLWNTIEYSINYFVNTFGENSIDPKSLK